MPCTRTIESVHTGQTENFYLFVILTYFYYYFWKLTILFNIIYESYYTFYLIFTLFTVISTKKSSISTK